METYIKCLVLALQLSGFILLSGCSGQQSPQEVAHFFWNAAIEEDIDATKLYTKDDAQRLMPVIKEKWHNPIFELGEIRINEDQAVVTTRIKNHNNSNELQQSVTEFFTVLSRENERWMIDVDKTYEQFSEQPSLERIVSELREMTKEMSTRVDQALSALQENVPVIESGVDTLRKDVETELKGQWDKHGEDIKEELREFGNALDKALDSKKHPENIGVNEQYRSI